VAREHGQEHRQVDGVAMVDKSAIFEALTKRNAVRRDAKLPVLDIHAEFDHAVSVALWNEGVERFRDEMPRIKQQVLAELREQRGADFPQSVGGHWMVNYEVSRRFLALLNSNGYHRPTSHHTIVYGSHREVGEGS
jgi:hypothetical protein